jgi:hypothetical protein
MKSGCILMALLILPMVGCQSGPTPLAGMSALRINVIAEEKAGYKDPDSRVMVYDSGTAKVKGPFERVDYSELDEIVVWVEPVGGGAQSPPASPMTIEVSAKTSATKLAGAVCVGQRLIVRNSGPVAGKFYSVSDGNEFNLGVIPAGGQGEYVVRAAGLIEVLSESSKDPVAETYAAPTKWVAVAQSGGVVDFADLPPGRYKVMSWHPRLPGYESIVTLSPNQSATASIKVGVNALPKVGPR